MIQYIQYTLIISLPILYIYNVIGNIATEFDKKFVKLNVELLQQVIDQNSLIEKNSELEDKISRITINQNNLNEKINDIHTELLKLFEIFKKNTERDGKIKDIFNIFKNTQKNFKYRLEHLEEYYLVREVEIQTSDFKNDFST
jgi:hypothetical protein